MFLSREDGLRQMCGFLSTKQMTIPSCRTDFQPGDWRVNRPVNKDKLQITLPGASDPKCTTLNVSPRVPGASQHSKSGNSSSDSEGLNLGRRPRRSNSLPIDATNWTISAAKEPVRWVQFDREKVCPPNAGERRAMPLAHSSSLRLPNTSKDVLSGVEQATRGSHQRVGSVDQRSINSASESRVSLQSAVDEFAELALSRSMSNPVTLSATPKHGHNEKSPLAQTARKSKKVGCDFPACAYDCRR